MWTLAIIGLCVCSARSEDQVALAKGGDICAGGPKKKEYGPTTFVGLANGAACTSEATKPAEYISYSVTNFGLIKNSDADGTAYVTDPATHLVDVPLTGDVYFEPPAEHTEGDFKYASFSFGKYAGEKGSASFGYVGMWSALGIEGNLNFRTNSFLVEDKHHETCVSPTAVGANTECGPDISASAGTLKFSLFGYGSGDNHSNHMADHSYIGFRTRVDTTNMGGQKTYFNGDAAGGGSARLASDGEGASAVGTTQILSMYVEGATSHLFVEFPQYFNYGKIEGTGNNSSPVKKGSAEVKIRFVPAEASISEGGKVFYLDFLFTKATDGVGEKDGWFAYDPSVSKVDTPTPTPQGGTASTAHRAATAGTLATVGVAMMALLSLA